MKDTCLSGKYWQSTLKNVGREIEKRWQSEQESWNRSCKICKCLKIYGKVECSPLDKQQRWSILKPECYMMNSLLRPFPGNASAGHVK